MMFVQKEGEWPRLVGRIHWMSHPWDTRCGKKMSGTWKMVSPPLGQLGQDAAEDVNNLNLQNLCAKCFRWPKEDER